MLIIKIQVTYYLLSEKENNLELFLVVFPHILLFRFETKYKLDLPVNLDIN
jgi:hypothetical protein